MDQQDEPANVEREKFIIPYGPHGIPGPVCRVLREDETKFFVSLDRAHDPTNRHGVHPKGHVKNLWVNKDKVIAVGGEEMIEKQRILENGLSNLMQSIETKSRQDGLSYLFIKFVMDNVTRNVLEGKPCTVEPAEVIPAGDEEERAACARMAIHLERTYGDDVTEVVQYLRGRSGQNMKIVEVQVQTDG